jgi:multiple sugar transport system substrate-binding protein
MNGKVTRRRFLAASAGLGAVAAGGGVTGLLSACSSSPATSTATSNRASLQFWDMPWGQTAYLDEARRLVAEFNSKHPDIQVTYRSIPWSDWPVAFDTAINAGRPPDVSTGGGYQAVQYYAQGAIEPVDDIVQQWRADGTAADLVAGVVEPLRYQGHYIALPWNVDIRLPFYRKDMLQQAGAQVPTDWPSLRTALKKVTSGRRYGMLSSGAEALGSHYLWFLMLSDGGGAFTSGAKLDFLAAPNMAAAELISQIVQDGSLDPASVGYTGNDMSAAFGRGDGAFVIETPAFPSQLTPDLQAQVAMLPPLKSPHGTAGTIYWVNNLMLYRQSPNKSQAKVFMSWWLANQKTLWTTGNSTQLPVRKSFYKDPYFSNLPYFGAAANTWLPLARTQATHAAGMFPALGRVDGSTALKTLAQQLFQGVPASAAMQQAASGLQSLVGQG